MPSPVLSSRGGNVSVRMAVLLVMTEAAPMPCTNRKAIMRSAVGARPQARVPSAKTTIPPM